MPELKAITAIADATLESMVAKILFENGWDVEKRVLDAHAIDTKGGELLLISLDLEGLTEERLEELLTSVSRTIIFGPNPRALAMKNEHIFDPRIDPNYLLSVIRGNQRQPLLQNRVVNSSRKQAKLLYFTSSRPGVGASFVASNVAMELSVLEKKVLIIDGDIHFPSLYHHLGVRDLAEPQSITPYLSAVDLSSSESDTYLQKLEAWMTEFEYVVLDGGAVGNVGDLSQDRRKEGALIIWALDRAAKSVLVTTPRELDLNAHHQTLSKLRGFKQQTQWISVLNQAEKGSKNNSAERYVELPRDDRSVRKCEKEKLLLNEGAQRSPLTKSISQFVREGLM